MDYREVRNWKEKKELKGLLDLSTPPKHLYYQGTWDPQLFVKCAAVIGSRKMTLYGEKVVEKLVPSLIAQGYTIVSGFMYGVDQYAHNICVKNGGRALAILGWGITTPLSGSDKKLANEIIANNGLLMSEWEDQKAAHWTFPARNRIVAALSLDVYVVEAAEHSGSLITARLAHKLKRKLWAVPGPITSRTSLGTNTLLADGKASMWVGQDSVRVAQKHSDDPILTLLDEQVLTIDEMYRKLPLSVQEIGARLSVLLLQGAIGEKEGKYFVADAS